MRRSRLRVQISCAVAAGNPAHRWAADASRADTSDRPGPNVNEQRPQSSPLPRRVDPVALVAAWDRRALPVRAGGWLLNLARRLGLRLAGAEIGRGVRLGRDIAVAGATGLRLGASSQIGPRARIELIRSGSRRGTLAIGARTRILNDAHIGAALDLEIGHDCLFAAGVTILDHDHDFADPLDGGRRNQGLVAARVAIGDHVFLGERATVLKGVEIGRGCVVGAHAVVTRDLPPLTMATGVPARVVARFDADTRRWMPAT